MRPRPSVVGIAGHFRNVHAAVGVPGDRHWADNVGLAGNQLDLQVRVGELKAGLFRVRRSWAARTSFSIFGTSGFAFADFGAACFFVFAIAASSLSNSTTSSDHAFARAFLGVQCNPIQV